MFEYSMPLDRIHHFCDNCMTIGYTYTLYKKDDTYSLRASGQYLNWLAFEKQIISFKGIFDRLYAFNCCITCKTQIITKDEINFFQTLYNLGDIYVLFKFLKKYFSYEYRKNRLC